MANHLIEESTMTAIADAIRSKTGSTDSLKPGDMSAAIEGISSGGFPNGSWTHHLTQSLGFFYGISLEYFKGHVIAVSRDAILYFDEGFKKCTKPSGCGSITSKPIFAKDICVIPCTNSVIYSHDGLTWEMSDLSATLVSHSSSTPKNDSFEYGNGVFCVGTESGIYYSLDGITWVLSDMIDPLAATSSISYADGAWVAATKGLGIYYSRDGKTWTQSNISTGNYTYMRPVKGGNAWVVVSYKEDGYTPSTLYYSIDDGATWETNTSSGRRPCSIAYNKGTWVLFEESTSTRKIYAKYTNDIADNTAWTECNGITQGHSSSSAYVGCVNDMWFYGTKRSFDGVNWIETEDSINARFVKYKHGMWFNLDYGYFNYSTDGFKWERVDLDTGLKGDLGDILYTNKMWYISPSGSSSYFYTLSVE